MKWFVIVKTTSTKLTLYYEEGKGKTFFVVLGWKLNRKDKKLKSMWCNITWSCNQGYNWRSFLVNWQIYFDDYDDLILDDIINNLVTLRRAIFLDFKIRTKHIKNDHRRHQDQYKLSGIVFLKAWSGITIWNSETNMFDRVHVTSTVWAPPHSTVHHRTGLCIVVFHE